MKYYVLLVIALFISTLTFSQKPDQAGPFIVRPTTAGIGKVDTRVDNMGYWKEMARLGYVEVEPQRSVAPAKNTGNRIYHPMVMTVNSTDVPVTNTNSTQSENSIFVNPSDSLFVLNSNNSTTNPVGSLYGADYLITADGGTTWGGSVTGAGGGNSGDPTTAISLDGRMYVGFINGASGQSVSYSTDNGSTWTPVVSGVLPPGGSLLDKNHMWIDNSPSSPYEGNLYNAWTTFGGTNDREIEVSRSTDGGLSWSTQQVISTAVAAGSHNQGVNIQTGPNGEVYIAWTIYDSWPSDETAIGMAISTDGGATYAPATRVVSNIKGIRNSATSKNQRVNSFPSMAVDISGGPNNGDIYIVWTNIGVPGTNTGSDRDIYMARSTDGGSTWDTPVRVNQDPSGLGKQHYFPWITCDPVSGDLCVIFYDDRNVSSTDCEVFVAYSFDGGTSWGDFKVSDVSFTPAPIPGLASGYMGDYLGITSYGGMVYPVWPDNRTGTIMSYVSPFELTREPTTAFIADNLFPCLNDTVAFMDMTSKTPTTWDWTITPGTFSYVNGTSSSSQNPEVRFEAYGDYSVQLITSNTYGSDTLSKPNYISVNGANANFMASSTTPVINTTVEFTDASSCDIVSYSWNFGTDANPATATTAGPHQVTYSSTGLKTVTLTINDTATETKTDYINVLPELYYMSNASLTVCSGTFYDSQGTNNYLNNENYVMTFNPGDPAKKIQVSFASFSLESHASCLYDWLKIYDGPSTSSPLLGTWCGANSPGTITSSDASGALTFSFHSDASVVSSGWQASVSCVDPPPPTYCDASAATCDEYIAGVEFAEINNPSACTSGGYHDYTSQTAVVSPGISQSITVINGSVDWPADQCGLWIDWNQDYDFDDANETISMTGSPGTGPYTASVNPPLDAAAGPTRARIRITFTGALAPCGSASYGEVEDYTVYVGTPGLWKGGTAGSESDWSVATNWDDHRVPTDSTDVLIPVGVTYYPELSDDLQCSDLQIEDNASLVVKPGFTLTVNGNLTIGEGSSGSLVVDGGTCNVTGTLVSNPGSTIEVKAGGVLNDIN